MLQSYCKRRSFNTNLLRIAENVNIYLFCMYPNNSGFMQNRNRNIKETITRRIQTFRWFGFWLTSTGSVEEKVSLIIEKDYKDSTKTLSQSPNPKYT